MKSNEVLSRIVRCLTKLNVQYEIISHAPVYTSNEASTVLHHPESEGTKSIALQTNQGLAVVTVSGIERVDFKQTQILLGVQKVRMCDPEVIASTLKTEIGGIAPFGHAPDVRLLISQTLLEQKNIYINPGVNNMTIQISGTDFEKVAMFFNCIIIPHTRV